MIFFDSTEAFQVMYDKILVDGWYHAGCRALFGVNFRIVKPQNKIIRTPWRKFNEEYAKLEWDWYISGNPNAEEIAKTAKIWYTCMDENGEVNSNYGRHWFRQLPEIGTSQYEFMLDILSKDKESRRAILSHYEYDQVHKYEKDTPCNISIQFLIHDDMLYLQVFCRSQDLVFGFCNDQYQWANLQMKVIEDLNCDIKLQPGYIDYHFGHIHIYPRHYGMKSKSLMT